MSISCRNYNMHRILNSNSIETQINKQDIHTNQLRKKIFINRKDLDLMKLFSRRGINKQLKISFPFTKLNHNSQSILFPHNKLPYSYTKELRKSNLHINNISKINHIDNRIKCIERLQHFEKEKCKELFKNESIRQMIFHNNVNMDLNSFIEFIPVKPINDSYLNISHDKIRKYSFQKQRSRNDKIVFHKDYSLPDINQGRVIDLKYKIPMKKYLHEERISSSLTKEKSINQRKHAIIKQEFVKMVNEQGSQT